MANASLQSNVAQEMARRRVTDELLPRQSRLNQQYGPPDIPLPDNVVPYQTFEQPSDNVKGFFDPGYGDAPASVAAPDADSPPGSGVSPAVAEASAMSNAVNSPIGMALAALAPMGVPVAMALNAQANNALDEGMAAQAAQEAQVSLDAFGPDSSPGVGPGPDSATDASSVGAVNGADSASDAAAAAAAADGDGGGGGGGGGKIVCTAMCQAYGFGAYRQNVWLEYSAKHLKKEHARGYHRIFRPLVKYAFHSGTSIPKRIVRHWLETIMRMRTVDLWHEMRGKNPRPVGRLIRRACEYICYGVGKL